MSSWSGSRHVRVSERVRIHYTRPPDRITIYDQRVALTRDDVIVTISDPLPLKQPLTIGGGPGLENGSLAVWFTFPDVWHDIGRFHLAGGSLTGVYANILSPPRIDGPDWYTTDLWLDVWIRPGHDARLLDVDEFDAGVSAGLIDTATAERAREEARSILERASSGTWPPPIVEEWTLERTLAAIGAP